jgi:ppGpp synthetase/RelA/SpoT-type nucleotidyltranferase
MSRSALDKLGKRVALSDMISDTDLIDLQGVLTTCAELLAVIKPRVDRVVEEARSSLALDVATPTSRPKTIGTIHDKLRRERGMGLKGMQDLAGIRVVGDVDRRQQDQLYDLLTVEFTNESAAPKRVDRRENPSFGYRALHVIVFPGGMPVEIQIRTIGQQLWANLSENLADAWGRQIRYGGEPNEPDMLVGAGMTRRDVVGLLQETGDLLDMVERLDVEILKLEPEMQDLDRSELEDRQEDATRRYSGQLSDHRARYARAHQARTRALRSFAMSAGRIRGALG